MARAPKESLRAVTAAEREGLQRLHAAGSERVDHVRQATALLAVAQGHSFARAARQAGFHSASTVAGLVLRFNAQGLEALHSGAGRGRKPVYDAAARARIVATAPRPPDRTRDGTTQTAARRRHGDRSAHRGKKGLIALAWRLGEAAGVPVWCQAEAGPWQAVPQPGAAWQPGAKPARRPHASIRGGTAKLLTLFPPATGTVRAKGVRISGQLSVCWPR